MVLRSFLPDDINEVASLFLETVWRINIRDYTPEQIRAWAPPHLDPGALGRRLLDSFSLVAVRNETIAGFGNLEASGHVDCLYVHADFQKLGIGSAILKALEEEARRLDLARLFTEASITARPFFLAQGYVVLERQFVDVRGVTLENYKMEKPFL